MKQSHEVFQSTDECTVDQVLTNRIKAVITFQFVSVGLVLAYGPCAALQFFFDSVINNVWIMAGGLSGNVLSFFLLQSWGLRYTVMILYAMLLLGWMCTFGTVQYMLSFDSSASLYCCFFLNGVPIGMLFGSVFPHLQTYCRGNANTEDLYYWPQLGIILGVCIVELTLSLGAWQLTVLICMLIAFASMFTSRIFPKASPYGSELIFCQGFEQIYCTLSTKMKTMYKDKAINNDDFHIDIDNELLVTVKRQMKSVLLVALQHFTGLSLLSLVEIIGMNLSKDPQTCFQIFCIVSLLAVLGIRMLCANVSTQIVLPSGLMAITFLVLSYMHYLSQQSGAFFSLPAMTVIILVIGISTALGKFHIPMVDHLLELPARSYHLPMLVVLTSWWGFGLVFSLIFANLLFSHDLCIVFTVMGVLSLSVAVMCTLITMQRRSRICQLI